MINYKTIFKPIVMYGSDIWTETTNKERRLNVWERKVLRKIYGPVRKVNEWRMRTNQELKSLHRETDLVRNIKIRRLNCLGHVQKIEEEGVGKPGGRWLRGRPMIRR